MALEAYNSPVPTPPWSFHGPAYVFFIRDQDKPEPSQVAGTEKYSDLIPSYKPGMILFFRYETTPLGPYDELIYIPGSFDYPKKRGATSQGARVTKIWVSSAASAYHGRDKLNIPKQVAHFEVTPLSSGIHLKVFAEKSSSSPPGGGLTTRPHESTPFFSAKFYTSRLTPISLPLIVPALNVQPPLADETEGGVWPERVASHEEGSWLSYAMTLKAWGRLGSAEGVDEDLKLDEKVTKARPGKYGWVGDGQSAPRVRLWQWGLAAPSATLHLQAATRVDQ